MKSIQAGYETDLVLKKVISELALKVDSKKHYSLSQGVLRRKNKVVIPNVVQLKESILNWLHCSGSGGHSGRDATTQRVKGIFYWKGMAKDIQAYIRGCAVCQQ